MAALRKTIDLTVGEKVTKTDVEAAPEKIGDGQPTPSSDPEVVGRCFKAQYVQCPICNAINYVYVDDEKWLWYRCWNKENGVHYFKV